MTKVLPIGRTFALLEQRKQKSMDDIRIFLHGSGNFRLENGSKKQKNFAFRQPVFSPSKRHGN